MRKFVHKDLIPHSTSFKPPWEKPKNVKEQKIVTKNYIWWVESSFKTTIKVESSSEGF